MKIGLIQSNPVAGALRYNAEALLAAVFEAGSLGADLCIAPELALCGHDAGDLLLQSDFAPACRDMLNFMAAKLHAQASAPPLLLGAPVLNPVPLGKSLQNCAVLLRDGKVMVIARKVLLPSTGVFVDTRYFEPGVGCGVLQHKGWRFLVTVGEDVWNDRTFRQERRSVLADPVAEFMGAGGADALLNLTALPYAGATCILHQRIQCRHAAQYRIPVAVANCVGGNDGLIYYGGSLVVSAEGVVTARAALFEEGVIVTDLAAKKAGSIAPDLPAEEELRQALVLGVRDFAGKCGFTKAILGLSGGIDSALVAAIACDALGAANVTGLLMPSPYSSKGSIDDSLALAQNFGMTTHTLPIAPMMGAYETSFAAVFAGGLAGIAEENIQARIRGNLLMAYANRFNSLVLSTGNKSEMAVGYCTLYGDMCGGLSVIGDLYKRDVYALSRWYNKRVGMPLIPVAILEKSPSAELREGQKDADSLPEYPVLDAILQAYIEQEQSLEDLLDAGYPPDVVRRVLHLVHMAEFKRHQAPPILHVTLRAFGTDWHMPVARKEPLGRASAG